MPVPELAVRSPVVGVLAVPRLTPRVLCCTCICVSCAAGSASRSRSPRRGRSASRSRSRSRSRSPAARRSRSPSHGRSMDVMKLSDQDIAFVLGKGGSTKMKLARVSGAHLEIHEREMTLSVRHGFWRLVVVVVVVVVVVFVHLFHVVGCNICACCRSKARRTSASVPGSTWTWCWRSVSAPSSLTLTRSAKICSSLTCRGCVVVCPCMSCCHCFTDLCVVQSAVGYVTGGGGRVLRSLEQEWGTLMFFAKAKVCVALMLCVASVLL